MINPTVCAISPIKAIIEASDPQNSFPVTILKI